jgi:hypothetical protein
MYPVRTLAPALVNEIAIIAEMKVKSGTVNCPAITMVAAPTKVRRKTRGNLVE